MRNDTTIGSEQSFSVQVQANLRRPKTGTRFVDKDGPEAGASEKKTTMTKIMEWLWKDLEQWHDQQPNVFLSWCLKY